MAAKEENAEKCADSTESSSEREFSVEDKLILTTMDRFKKLVFSQQEWEAHLLHKLEKQEKAKGDTSPSKNTGLFQWLKNAFKTPQESQFFLETETKKFVEKEKKEVQEESPDSKET